MMKRCLLLRRFSNHIAAVAGKENDLKQSVSFV
jgi:hypothetical protein